MERASRIKEEIFGVLYILAGLVVLFSLISHSSWDTSFFTKSPELKNLLGLLGSYLSDFLLQVIGLSSYVFPLILAVSGVKKILGRAEKQRTLIYIGVFALLILSASSLLVLLFGTPSAGNPSGGVVGFLVTRLSLRFLSAVGSYLIFIPLVMVALMYLIQFSIVDIIRAIRERASSRAKNIPDISVVAEKNEEPPHIEETALPEPVYKQEPLPLSYPVEKKIIKPALKSGGYQLPGLELLRDPEVLKSKPAKEDLLQMSEFLEKKLRDFSVEGKVTYVSPGPVVTMFEYEPAPGIKISKIISLSDDLAMAFKANSLRISPIHGRATLGFEIPNQVRDEVFIKDVFASDMFKEKSSKLILALGKDIFGTPVTANLEKMPHLLVAGATGAGKSVTVNAMILSLLYRATPDEVRMLMIDPKMLELSLYEDIPHLLMPVITSPKEASGALKKVVFEMERRYRLLAETGSRNIEDYNRKISALPRPKKNPEEDTDVGEEESKEPLPYLIVIIDELADLMLVSGREVEDSIARLAQMARAAGIHLILATQRPSVDVITGLIKANFPSRIAFHVSSKIDSRIIIDTYGAEKLLGKGDMLFMSPGKKTTRVHGAYVSEEEVRDVVSFIKAQGRPDYKLFEDLISVPSEEQSPNDRDELYIQAKDLVLSTGQASISYIQRRMKIGYNRAASIMEMLEEDGIVGPPGEAGKPREVLRRKQ